MARIKSREKRRARQTKMKRRCESNVSDVGGLFLIGDLFKRSQNKLNLSDDEIQKIAIFARMALNNLLFGKSSDDDWGDVTAAINTGLILSERGFGPEHEGLFIQAQEALSICWKRGKRTGIWRFDGKGAEVMRNAIDIHEIQIEHTTVGDIRKAYQEVLSRIDEGNVFEIERVAA